MEAKRPREDGTMGLSLPEKTVVTSNKHSGDTASSLCFRCSSTRLVGGLLLFRLASVRVAKSREVKIEKADWLANCGGWVLAADLARLLWRTPLLLPNKILLAPHGMAWQRCAVLW